MTQTYFELQNQKVLQGQKLLLLLVVSIIFN